MNKVITTFLISIPFILLLSYFYSVHGFEEAVLFGILCIFFELIYIQIKK